MSKFIHLHTHSHYSLLDGLAKIDELVARAKELGMDALALTDHGNLYGAVEFYKKAKAAGIKPILGVEAYVAPRTRFDKTPKIDDKRTHLTLLVKNETGWKNLIQLITKANLEGFYYKPRIDRELIEKFHEGLICLSGCFTGEIARMIKNGKIQDARQKALEYKNIFGGDFYLELQPHAPEIHPAVIQISKETGIPLVATHDIHYVRKEDKTAHEVLLAVQTHSRLEDEDRMSLKGFDVSMISAEEMAGIFKDIPEALANTIEIAGKCSLELNLGKTLFPNFPLPDEETDPYQYLVKLVRERTAEKFPQLTEEIKNRIEFELSMIRKTGFSEYMLIVQDFVNWAKQRGIVVGPGRGSAASSVVSYILGVTDVDPLRYGLFFERFLNPERIQQPDIDIDFADSRRDEVVAYVREKYGLDKVAQIITFGTMAARAAIRDAGRALGLSYGFCDQLAKLIPFNMNLEKSLQEVEDLKKMYNENADAKKLIDAAKKLEGVARHASVHACGVVMTKEPLINYLPLQKAPQDENTIVTQFEMHSVEDLGLLKMDFLGLRNLTIIEEAIRLIKEAKGKEINIGEIPLNDPAVFELFRKGETTGIFQFEGAGMTRYLKEMKTTRLEDLIAMVALFRPGPMELIPRYISRKHGKEPITYLHPKLKPILESTYGVITYQEQLLQIARDLAGFSLGEADILRKAVGKKIKSLLDEQTKKFISGVEKNMGSRELGEKLWKLIEPFAGYGFNKSHSVCYALIGYRTAYLKAHYPIEFFTALLNASAGDIERAAFLVNEARKMKISVLPPDINQSSQKFTPGEKTIRFGLLAVKNVGENIVDVIIEEKMGGGPFSNLEDFLNRVRHRNLNKKSLESLIKCGALESLGIERSTALENIEKLLKFNSLVRKDESERQNSLFGSQAQFMSLNLKTFPPADIKTKLAWEKELLGLYISDHPLKPYLGKLQNGNIHPIAELTKNTSPGRKPFSIGGIISKVNKIITRAGKPMLFVKLEDMTDNMEVVVFSDTLEKNQTVWRENNIVLVNGRLDWRNGEPKMICEKATEL